MSSKLPTTPPSTMEAPGNSIDRWFGGEDDAYDDNDVDSRFCPPSSTKSNRAAHREPSLDHNHTLQPAENAGPSRRPWDLTPSSVQPATLCSVAKDHRKMAALPSSKKFSTYIDKWNSQLEQQTAEMAAATTRGESSSNVVPLGSKAGSGNPEQQSGTSLSVLAEDFDYSDEDRKACLLCQRQFKAIEVLYRHTAESELHKRNLQDEEICKAGRERKGGRVQPSDASTPGAKASNMKRAGFAPVAAGPIENGSTPYRDRASERREVFGVESRPKGSRGGPKVPPTVVKTGDVPSATKVDDRLDEEQLRVKKLDESSVGGALLAKMGWTSGKGLGATGDGRVDPVQASIYAQGAGLGSARARPESVEEHAASKRARPDASASYSDFSKDRTRLRFTKAGDK